MKGTTMLLPAIALGLVLASLGLRVLLRARNEGGLPHYMVGAFFLALGLGAAPALLAADPTAIPPDAAAFAMGGGHAILSVGFGALAIFAWTCFGPSSAWRQILALALCGTLFSLWLAQGVVEKFTAPGGSIVRVASLVRAITLVWAFIESIRYRVRMKRRASLGLADPVVANRFLLWSLWIGALLVGIGVTISVRFLLPEFSTAATTTQRVVVTSSIIAAAMVSAISLWLAFFPPRPYLSWLKGESTA
jgi:hypothetical protein